jgi:hypothetical protein
MPDLLAKLESDREALLAALAATGDMRRGSITEVYRACGKPTCACAGADHPGHGPYYAFTRKVEGTTQTRQLRSGPQLSKLEREVETYRQFRTRCQQLIEVNEALCEVRPLDAVGPEKKRPSRARSKRRSSRRSRRS